VQEPEWAAVFDAVHDLEDALALMALFEYRSDALFANDLPVDALLTEAAFLSERGFADLLATHLNARTGSALAYTDLYSPTRSHDAEKDRIDALIERCHDAGVELHHRPEPPTPWRVVISQLADDTDLAVFAILRRHYSANSWWIDLEVDLEMPREVAPIATAGQLADLVARCRRAGVVLRPNLED